MIRLRGYVLPILIALLVITSLVTPQVLCENKPIVVTTTSVLGSIVRDLAGDLVDVIVIATPTICPAHYDIKPSDVEAVKRAIAIFYHGFEPWVETLVKASGTKAKLVKIPGPWNTPTELAKRYRAVASALEEVLGVKLSERLSKCLKAINETAAKLKALAERYRFSEYRVVCMKWQVPFIKWLGFQIVATYGPPERLSTREVVEIERTAREKGAVLVIDNLQSGTWFGRSLAEKLGIVHVALTNFPGTEPGLNNVTSIMRYNVGKLIAAIKEVEVLSKVRSYLAELTTLRNLMYVLIIAIVAELAVIVILVMLYLRIRRR